MPESHTRPAVIVVGESNRERTGVGEGLTMRLGGQNAEGADERVGPVFGVKRGLGYGGAVNGQTPNYRSPRQYFALCSVPTFRRHCPNSVSPV